MHTCSSCSPYVAYTFSSIMMKRLCFSVDGSAANLAGNESGSSPRSKDCKSTMKVSQGLKCSKR